IRYGAHVTSYMEHFGVGEDDLARVAVSQRQHAALNTKALMRHPITIEDHHNSPWIARPFRRLDCCPRSDGAMALVVTSAERARDLRRTPVLISAAQGGSLSRDGQTGRTEFFWETNAVHAAPRIYEAADIAPSDIDVAELYDPFTGMCMLHIE